ncbi:DUF1444 domain-containing protein [Listeria booriae]|uniref:DUF1444 domain-containing protein n=1 Tax=Listeria booriae TaxID=1552123 RepID=A0A7X0YY43_9LIST|nr:DUF1444 domain-containing protein [Listeria booriae]MBC2165703.1 DUF1444 domain-containing protein [Listeria booriae]MBC2172432.1 DUF1444 domain-containing protein [Listeria booriae]
MTTLKMKERLEKELGHPNRAFRYDREKDTLKVTEAGNSITLSIPQIIANWEENGDVAVEKIVYYVVEGLKASQHTLNLRDSLAQVYPVIRATSFPRETKDGKALLVEEHTAETAIFYVVDIGSSYRFIEEDALQDGLTLDDVRLAALANLRQRETPTKKDSVAGNDFYFVRTNDGYDASRILNEAFLREMRAQLEGEMVLGVPHQDVLIVADIRNNTGYDVLAHMTMQFFADGLAPITSLPLVYNDGKLEPIFIMAKNRPKE